MKKKLLNLFSINIAEESTDNSEKKEEHKIETKTNETNQDKELEKYKQENFKPDPSKKKEEDAKMRKRRKRIITWSIVALVTGGIIFWIVAANWTPPIYKVESYSNGSLKLSNGKTYKITKNSNLTATFGTTSNQLKFTLDGGLFSGVSFYGWRDNTDIIKIGDQEAVNMSSPNISGPGNAFYNAVISATAPTVSPSFFSVLINLLPTILIFAMVFMSFKLMKAQTGSGGGESLFGIGKSPAKLAQTNVKFSDVAGIKEEKNELMELVDYLKNPGKYAAMGARAPKGVILYGPPGTGKTLLAKAVAGEAGVPFFEASGSSFEDMLVGVGAKRVRDLFKKASAAAPSIIFIDEIDSVASKRGKNEIAGASGGIADQTINQLLAEMDGFSTNSGVIVIAATNRLDVLDPAILRPGRFDRQIQINLPDIKERVEILKIHSRNKNISSSVKLEEIARRTPGFSGAQLENVLNEATLLAVRENKNTIGMKELDEAIDRVIAGPAKQTRVITKEEKEQIAYHEAGHALVGLHNPGADIVEKITIIPRGRAAGYTLSTPEKQEMSIQRKNDLLSIISSTLGGRAAEELIYGKDKVSTGASNDLYKVTNIVRSMVMQLGMSSLGMTQFVPSEGTVNPYASKLYSDETALAIDKEVNKIIDEQYKKAINTIKKNRKELDLIVESLIILETITREQIEYIHKNLKLPKEALDAKSEMKKTNKTTKQKEKKEK